MLVQSVPISGKVRIVLPDLVDMTIERFDLVYPEWLRWVGTGRRFLPRRGGLRDQPSDLMDDFFFLDGLYENLIAVNTPESDKGS